MDTEQNLRLAFQQLLSKLLLGLAALLLAFKIYADSEPGALPLLLLLIGATWYFIIRYRLKTQKRKQKYHSLDTTKN